MRQRRECKQRLTLDLTASEQQVLDQLTQHLGRSSKASVARLAIRLLNDIIAQQQQGVDLIYRDPSGNEKLVRYIELMT